MDRLGRMLVDLTMVECLLRIDFFVENEMTKAVIESQYDAVAEVLAFVYRLNRVVQ